jgi:hypothetical protein
VLFLNSVRECPYGLDERELLFGVDACILEMPFDSANQILDACVELERIRDCGASRYAKGSRLCQRSQIAKRHHLQASRGVIAGAP